jgi:hypothetical protein
VTIRRDQARRDRDDASPWHRPARRGVGLAALRVVAWALFFSAAAATACAVAHDGGVDAGLCEPWAVRLVDFDPGEGAGFGAEDLPGVVLGPPDGGKATQGALDVVSLGLAGVITVELGCAVFDGPGPDLFVYENPFVVGGGPRVFADPAEVAVSVDGVAWVSFPCVSPGSPVADDDGVDGCAGLTPVAANADNGLIGTVEGGGDAFDLGSLAGDDVDVSLGVRFVRIADRSPGGAAPNAGFDLDAVGTPAR